MSYRPCTACCIARIRLLFATAFGSAGTRAFVGGGKPSASFSHALSYMGSFFRAFAALSFLAAFSGTTSSSTQSKESKQSFFLGCGFGSRSWSWSLIRPSRQIIRFIYHGIDVGNGFLNVCQERIDAFIVFVQTLAFQQGLDFRDLTDDVTDGLTD